MYDHEFIPDTIDMYEYRMPGKDLIDHVDSSIVKRHIHDDELCLSSFNLGNNACTGNVV
jgi:hypothetical protein